MSKFGTIFHMHTLHISELGVCDAIVPRFSVAGFTYLWCFCAVCVYLRGYSEFSFAITRSFSTRTNLLEHADWSCTFWEKQFISTIRTCMGERKKKETELSFMHKMRFQVINKVFIFREARIFEICFLVFVCDSRLINRSSHFESKGILTRLTTTVMSLMNVCLHRFEMRLMHQPTAGALSHLITVFSLWMHTKYRWKVDSCGGRRIKKKRFVESRMNLNIS